VPVLSGIVNQPAKFEVDASQAGTGQLEIAIENGRIPCTFQNQGNLRFIPSFTPFESGRHEITIKFNGYEVPGSPFYCQVVDVNKITVLGATDNLYSVYKSGSLELSINGMSSEDINVKLTSPSRLNVPVSRVVTPQNTMKISFQPQEIGTGIFSNFFRENLLCIKDNFLKKLGEEFFFQNYVKFSDEIFDLNLYFLLRFI
jgi:filamin